jgi:hypothetical protein
MATIAPRWLRSLDRIRNDGLFQVGTCFLALTAFLFAFGCTKPKLTVQANGQGSVTVSPPGDTYAPAEMPKTIEYDPGTQVTLTGVPDANWSFNHWEGALTGSTSPATLTMDVDKQVTAVFANGPPPADPNWPADSFTFDVTWGPNTTLVDRDHANLIKAVDPENATYTFDSLGARNAGLVISVGRILAIHREGICRVTSVDDDGQDLVVHIGPAKLTDAIKDGTIA